MTISKIVKYFIKYMGLKSEKRVVQSANYDAVICLGRFD